MQPTMPKWILVKSSEKRSRYKWIICILVDGFSEDMHYDPYSYFEYQSEAKERMNEFYKGWKE